MIENPSKATGSKLVLTQFDTAALHDLAALMYVA